MSWWPHRLPDRETSLHSPTDAGYIQPHGTGRVHRRSPHLSEVTPAPGRARCRIGCIPGHWSAGMPRRRVDLARRSVRWRVPLRWYLVALFTVPVGAVLIYGTRALTSPPGGWPRALAEMAPSFCCSWCAFSLLTPSRRFSAEAQPPPPASPPQPASRSPGAARPLSRYALQRRHTS
jgi:hypothetical protein